MKKGYILFISLLLITFGSAIMAQSFPQQTLWAVDDQPAKLHYYVLSQPNSLVNVEGEIQGITGTKDIEALTIADNGDIYIMNNVGTSKLYVIPVTELDGDENTPVNAKYIGDSGLKAGGNPTEITSLEFVDGKLYGLAKQRQKLYEVSTTDGSVTELADLAGQNSSFRIDGLTTGADGVVYLSRTGAGANETELWKFDSFPGGNITKVMDVTGSVKVEGLAAHPNGYLYMADDEHWFEIDPLNKISTKILDYESDIEGIDFWYASESSQQSKISPILECVVKHNANSFTAYFGYLNPNPYPVIIPVGAGNKFNGGSSQDMGQPTVFQPGRTSFFPNTAFQAEGGSGNLVWILNGKTSTAGPNSSPCSEHIFFEKVWLDENGGTMLNPPANLPNDYKITATSSVGTAVGQYVNGTLEFTYDNGQGNDTEGLWVPINETYTVTEENLPDGFEPFTGTGTFTALVPNGEAENPFKGIDKYGLHRIKNKQAQEVCVTDWTGSFDGPDSAICEYDAKEITVSGSVQLTPGNAKARLQMAWRIVYPNRPDVDNSTHYSSVWITGDTTFTITADWPGITAQDSVVEIHYGANILDCSGNPIHNGIGRDLYWYPWVCDAPEPDEADIRLEKSVSDASPDDGDVVTYTVQVFNDGPGSASGVEVSDLIPDGTEFVSANASAGTYDETTGVWDVGTVANGGSETLTIDVRVDLASLNTQSIDLGPATGFNLFVLRDIEQPSSDTEGKVAVGRNANFRSYSIGDKIQNGGPNMDALIVSKNLTYTSGRVFNGNVVYGKSTNLPQFQVSINEGTLRKDNPINFGKARNHLRWLSKQLYEYTTNGTTNEEWGGIFLTGNHPRLNVFEVSGESLSQANDFQINVPNGSVVVVNIDGKDVSWSGGLEINGTELNNVIYNFRKAKTLNIESIDVKGTILAPWATLNFPSGVVNGQVICNDMYGAGQFNNQMFIGNLPPVPEILNIAEVTAMNEKDPDSDVNNGDENEDDYASALITVEGDDDPDNGDTGAGFSQWESVGQIAPNVIVWTLARDGNNELLAGTWGGEIYRIDNQIWTKLNDGMAVGYIWDLAVDASGDIFAATERGVYASFDDGVTWTLQGLENADVRALVVDTHGDLYAGTWGLGVFKSFDKGKNWIEVNNGLTIKAVHALALNGSGEVYAGTYGEGVLKYDDNAQTWVNLNMGYPYVWSLAINDNDLIVAGTYGSGVYVSENDGAAWVKQDIPAKYVYGIETNDNGGIYITSWDAGVYAVIGAQLAKAADDELPWNSLGMNGFSASSVVLNSDGTHIYVGTANGTVFKKEVFITSVNDETNAVPQEFKLEQNYPNPFNPSTTIEFSIQQPGRYQIRVYDILGQLVSTLIDRDYSAGYYKVTFDARNLASGIYVYQLTGNNVNLVKKMMLIK